VVHCQPQALFPLAGPLSYLHKCWPLRQGGVSRALVPCSSIHFITTLYAMVTHAAPQPHQHPSMTWFCVVFLRRIYCVSFAWSPLAGHCRYSPWSLLVHPLHCWACCFLFPLSLASFSLPQGVHLTPRQLPLVLQPLVQEVVFVGLAVQNGIRTFPLLT
jgi:hypothetical protein